jgi:large subunit ribosomal protein L35
MSKQKTHKGLQKRVKVTATGKVKHKRASGSHLMSGKNAKRRRRIAAADTLTGLAARSARLMLGK